MLLKLKAFLTQNDIIIINKRKLKCHLLQAIRNSLTIHVSRSPKSFKKCIKYPIIPIIPSYFFRRRGQDHNVIYDFVLNSIFYPSVKQSAVLFFYHRDSIVMIIMGWVIQLCARTAVGYNFILLKRPFFMSVLTRPVRYITYDETVL